MCVYCMMADHFFKWSPPPAEWIYPIVPYTIPQKDLFPTAPPPVGTPWSKKQYEEVVDILRRVKALEDKVDVCPCEPDASKLEFLDAIKRRLDELEKNPP